ncbi:F-box/kelch-repeat protein At3g27150-like [Amborella trichopoda]|uniref:Uncharacterized protein n=1 Tax=Amborella trichopoda TaxID=13333 RepID=W1PJ20_AMBTC|nr:F-box/kelch-repeat protein At3g27150-like [Amborella trichopoda]ERN09987.1 hypothetical protein AMTR_s00013p00224730 [Amborella trichopoda]|eukprot:XP_020525387.1 F-box/kelch-repeat protein At3g27150-like [Amborella trichopoda]
MLSKHSLFASANSGSCAFVVGGCAYVTSSLTARVPMNSAVQYDPETCTWRPLPPMHRKRTHCSGFFMSSKFYVGGGEGVNRDDLKCGEFYDPEMNEWVLVEGMRDDRPIPTGSDGRPLPRSQLLVAVVNGCELYELEPCMNALEVYEEEEKRWRAVGSVPVRADQNGGWGVAFKSLEDRLSVVGRAGSSRGDGGRVCACTYRPRVGWELLEGAVGNLDDFIFNCAVILT